MAQTKAQKKRAIEGKKKNSGLSSKNQQWKNKSLTMPMKNGKPMKNGDKPPFTHKKYNYKVKLSKRNKYDPSWTYDYVELQKEPPKNHIAEMIPAWSVFEVKTPKNRYTLARR